MDKIRIQGGRPLQGRIRISGAKNAALPVMPAALLSREPLHLTNLPDVADISSMRRLLQMLGAEVTLPPREPNRMTLHVPEVMDRTAPYDLVRKMRASILVLGPMLAREGHARVSLPGGCAIGARPVDLHLKGLEALGATIDLAGGYVEARVDGRLKGAKLTLAKPSVGATENIMMAATLAIGRTTIANAAREPEIVNLADCLKAMGAQIEGAGTPTITVDGVDELREATHAILPDRIETGTYAMAAAITGGDVLLENTRLDLLGGAGPTAQRAGVVFEEEDGGLRVRLNGHGLDGVDAITEPYPGFATDLQAQFMTAMCLAKGASMITETIFENRFMHVPELARMGANITLHGSTALVRGVERLRGAPVMATDLRASVSLVLAGLAAEGETEVNRIYHLDRGYERLEEKLRSCGAVVERFS